MGAVMSIMIRNDGNKIYLQRAVSVFPFRKCDCAYLEDTTRLHGYSRHGFCCEFALKIGRLTIMFSSEQFVVVREQAVSR